MTRLSYFYLKWPSHGFLIKPNPSSAECLRPRGVHNVLSIYMPALNSFMDFIKLNSINNELTFPCLQLFAPGLEIMIATLSPHRDTNYRQYTWGEGRSESEFREPSSLVDVYPATDKSKSPSIVISILECTFFSGRHDITPTPFEVRGKYLWWKLRLCAVRTLSRLLSSVSDSRIMSFSSARQFKSVTIEWRRKCATHFVAGQTMPKRTRGYRRI